MWEYSSTKKRNLKIILNEKQFEDFRDIFDRIVEEIIIKKRRKFES